MKTVFIDFLVIAQCCENIEIYFLLDFLRSECNALHFLSVSKWWESTANNLMKKLVQEQEKQQQQQKIKQYKKPTKHNVYFHFIIPCFASGCWTTLF